MPFFVGVHCRRRFCASRSGGDLAIPALRVQHHYLAFVTLAFTTLVFLVLRNEQWLTNGIYGITGTPRPTILGWKTSGGHDFYFSLPWHPDALSFATLVDASVAMGPRLCGACAKIRSVHFRSVLIRDAIR